MPYDEGRAHAALARQGRPEVRQYHLERAIQLFEQTPCRILRELGGLGGVDGSAKLASLRGSDLLETARSGARANIGPDGRQTLRGGL